MGFEIPSDYDFWVAVGTIALAAVTFGFLIETRKIRIASQRPSFAIEPVIYDEHNNVKAVNLVNHGQTASNIKAVCMWGEKLETQVGAGNTHYILSLARDSRAVLEIPISEIISKGQVLKIEITCKDVADRNYKAIIRTDFGEIKGTSTFVAYQYDALLRLTVAVKHMADSMREIEEKLNQDEK